MKESFLQQNVKKFIAVWLILWLSGVVFLFCCEPPRAEAEASADNDHCPLMLTANKTAEKQESSDHCDKQTSGENDQQQPQPASLDPGRNRALECCILPRILDKARKIEKIPQPALPAKNVKAFSPELAFGRVEFSPPFVYVSPVLSRSRTYLQNRAFRI